MKIFYKYRIGILRIYLRCCLWNFTILLSGKNYFYFVSGAWCSSTASLCLAAVARLEKDYEIFLIIFGTM